MKRWEIYNLCVLGEPMSAVVAGPFTDPKVRAVEVMAVEDHDRIMGERDEMWKRATKFVMPGEMDTGESIEHYIKTLEQTITELKAEIRAARTLDALVADNAQICEQHDEIEKLEATIARQAKVIEKLREQREFLIDVSDMSKEFRKIRRLDFDKELAAIEKGEGM